MPPPLVGITTYHREREGRTRFTLPDAYVDAVRAAGAMPVLLPPGESQPEDLLDRLDGLVLSGGGDLDPKRSGGAPHQKVYFVCGERDRFEEQLALGAVERGIPLLAICRGLQVLNVALGGAVHTHLPDVVGDHVAHRENQDTPTTHGVRLEPGSRLADLMGEADLDAVASWHHQAVAGLGTGLRPVAWAADGIVEALELENRPQVIAIQWHPELQTQPGSVQLRLFDWLHARAADHASA